MARKNYAANRLQRLKEHLQHENSDLTEAVDSYSELDQIAWNLGLLPQTVSYANHISWWPLVSVLGTFSAGKSSFINGWLGVDVQRSGNQAVDDHFTVLTYGPENKVKVLPGQALDSDPRFPFYQISKDIETVSPGDGPRIDKFLEMKVVPSDELRGKLVIDSPGFDADEQRKSTLRLTKHIVRLSDMVLVFFDARHPETGAMQDTLKHLVEAHLDGMDSEKFIYILNQIDTSASDNNLEDIVASWRSSLAKSGLSAGKFYVYYNEKQAIPVANKEVWASYKQKRDSDHKQIMAHLDGLNTVRTYRIVGNIKLLANEIEESAIPTLKAAHGKWRNWVRLTDLVLLGLLALVAFIIWFQTGFALATWKLIALLGGAAATFLFGHYLARKLFGSYIGAKLGDGDIGNLRDAFRKSTKWYRSAWLRKNPVGWSGRVRNRLDSIRNQTEKLIEVLNSKNSDPDGYQDKLEEAERVKKAALQRGTSAAKPVSQQTDGKVSSGEADGKTENISGTAKSDETARPPLSSTTTASSATSQAVKKS